MQQLFGFICCNDSFAVASVICWCMPSCMEAPLLPQRMANVFLSFRILCWRFRLKPDYCMKWSLYKMNSKFFVESFSEGLFWSWDLWGGCAYSGLKTVCIFFATHLRMRQCWYGFEVRLCPSVTFLIQIMSLELPPISRLWRQSWYISPCGKVEWLDRTFKAASGEHDECEEVKVPERRPLQPRNFHRHREGCYPASSPRQREENIVFSFITM